MGTIIKSASLERMDQLLHEITELVKKDSDEITISVDLFVTGERHVGYKLNNLAVDSSDIPQLVVSVEEDYFNLDSGHASTFDSHPGSDICENAPTQCVAWYHKDNVEIAAFDIVQLLKPSKKP